MKEIYNITKCVSGNVLAIGVDEKIVKILEDNERVINCNLLNSDTYSKSKNSTKNKNHKLKKIKIKKIRKIFKKKKIDFIICNIEEIKKYTKTFIKDSIYINKDMLYIYNIKNNELQEELIKKYKRYNVEIETINNKNENIIKIDNKKSTTNLIKDILYLIIDTFVSIIDVISDILMN